LKDDCNLSLLEGVREGDSKSLTALYDRYSKLIYSVALRVLNDSASAEDVLQDVFMKIWRHPERYLRVSEDLGDC